MKSIRFSLTVLLAFLFQFSYSQVTGVPQSAKDNFAKQYPAAQDVDWDNDVVNVNVRFTLNSEKMNAEYSNKGTWKNTYQNTSFEKLPAEVQDGFKKSKYADREITDTKIIYLPADVTQYRIRAEKNDVEKKYLYFDTTGKLLRDAITL
ncbi:MAG: PepSY-like domain-containing protein [Rhizobacter sp.]|nr:PepSY-like domain-containing protein [Ferruginibacter sp.]